jgi:predicted O-methyltransferase YrrM
MMLLDKIRSHKAYELLRGVHNSDEGNILEITDERTAEAQIEFMRWVMAEMYPRNILEIGFNKGMFGLLLHFIRPHSYLTAIDINPKAASAANILNQYTTTDVDFMCGSSQEIVPNLQSLYDLVWIDGEHSYFGAYTDLCNVSENSARVILLDDTNMPSVYNAYNDWLNTTVEYREIVNPYIDYDARKARIFVRQ